MKLMTLALVDLYDAANIGDDHVGYNAVFMLIMGLQEVVYRANCNWID